MFILTRFLSLLMFINVCVGKDLDKTPQKRIINGQNAELFDFPSLASLSKRRIGAWSHYCSAVLVSPTKLVTAAHCVRNKKIINVRVSLGMVNLFGPPNEFEQVLRVDKFYVHDGSYITNDIAVITMATPAKLNKNVKVAVLAEKDSNYVKENCTISGWGRTNVEVFNQTNSLQKAMTSIVSTEECMQRWTRLNTVLSEGTLLCVLDETGPPKKRPSSCFGDNGGPLYCGENKDVLVGVSSTGSGIRCNGMYPQLYTSIPAFRDWLDKRLDL